MDDALWRQELFAKLDTIIELLGTKKRSKAAKGRRDSAIPEALHRVLDGLFDRYPKPGGRSEAKKAFEVFYVAEKGDDAVLRRFQAAFDHYLKYQQSQKAEIKFYKNLPTFVRQHMDWLPKVSPVVSQPSLDFQARI